MSFTRQSILFISGLDKSLNENMLYQLFNEFPISYIKIAKDHLNRESFGYAFVGFKSHSKAEEAIIKLNYSKLGKKTIRISWYNRDPSNFRNLPEYNIFVKKINKNVTHKEFHDYFSKFGNIISARLVEDEEGETVGYGFILYDNKESTVLSIKEANGALWKGKNIYVGQFIKNKPLRPPQFNNVYVKNIPKSWDILKFANFFSEYGQLGSILIKEPDRSKLDKLSEEKKNQILSHKFAFICFKDFDAAKNVVNTVPFYKLNNVEYNNEIIQLVNILKSKVDDENLNRASVYIVENIVEYKNILIKNDQALLDSSVESFKNYLRDNDNVYIIRDQSDRLECFQALKKSDRLKKIKQLHEKIKKQIKERYRFCNLYVKNLPDMITDQDLKKLFEKYGEIRSAKTVKKELYTSYLGIKSSLKVFGFVCFFDAAKAREAKYALNGVVLSNSKRKLFVDYHQTKQERADVLKLNMMSISNKIKTGKLEDFRTIGRYSNTKPFAATISFGTHMLRKFPPQTMVMIPDQYSHMHIIQNLQPQNIQKAQLTEVLLDKNARRDYYGERLFAKISMDPNYSQFSG